MHSPQPLELLVAFPVFNESASLAETLASWIPAIARETKSFVFLAINDGSTDESGQILEQLKSRFSPHLEVLHQPNAGHGRTCLLAYRHACHCRIPFVLQIDSDGQCDPDDFPSFWKNRRNFDVIYGNRLKRSDGWRRVLASKILRLVIFAFAGCHCPDANVPFRLMKTNNLRSYLDRIPEDFFLANIALAVLLQRDSSIRQGVFPIQFHARVGGEPSVPLSRFSQKAMELIRQLKTLPR